MLSWILYHIPSSGKYVTFNVPKRNGTNRVIHAPQPKLKLLQRRVANVLNSYIEDHNKTRKSPPRPVSHGFEIGRSIITNALIHRNRRYVCNLDIKDFFPSMNFGRVRSVFINDRMFGWHKDVATIFAQIACYDNELPQGSPCSPVISNLVARILDARMVSIGKKYRCTYSRYADDITFSTNAKVFPQDVARPVPTLKGGWEVGQELEKAIAKVGFTVNTAKTRLQYRGSRQVTTGLIVNEKVNIKKEYYKTARSMSYQLFKTGAYYRILPAALAGGAISDPNIRQAYTKTNVIEGIFTHIFRVHDKIDQRSLYDKKKEPSNIRILYRRILFYKNFVSNEVPVVLCEGKTDYIYLRGAITKLTKFHPQLATITPNGIKLAVRLLNYSKTTRDVLQLSGGTGDLCYLVRQYKIHLKEYLYQPLKYPVIIVLDNDDGATELFKWLNANGVVISLTSKQPFYHITHNLYVIKTIERGSTGTSCIEDSFDAATKSTELNGLKFDANKKHNEAGKYGKTVFAEKVIKPNVGTITFAGFDDLLARITAVMNDYAAKTT